MKKLALILFCCSLCISLTYSVHAMSPKVSSNTSLDSSQKRYLICYHKGGQNQPFIMRSLGKSYTKQFSSLAKAIEFRSKNNIEEYAIQRVPNASTFLFVDKSMELRIKKLKIPYVKPDFKAPPLPYNLKYGRCNSITVPIEYEMLAAENLQNCPFKGRYCESKFDKTSPLSIPLDRPDRVSGTDAKFLMKSYQVAETAGFDDAVVPVAMSEALSDLSYLEIETNPNEEPVGELRGMVFDVENSAALIRIRSRLPKGYTAYEFENKYLESGDCELTRSSSSVYISRAVIVKTMSDDEFLRLMQTDAGNYSLSNIQIRKKVKSWKTRYNAELLGAWKMDSLSLLFPQILDEKIRRKLAKEIVDFCEEITMMNEDGKAEVEADLSSDGIIRLWWD